MLSGKKIALCITGSVAAIQCPIIARELMRNGAEVYAVMSENAQKIITPILMEWATGNPVVTKLTGKVEHITLAGDHPHNVDLVLVAPATANTISKIAQGIDDTTVTTVVSTAIGAGIPIIIVPAMHESMYRHPIIKQNIRKLKKIGIEFVGPRIEEGKAKIAHVDDIVEHVISMLIKPKDLRGLRILITAGGTREYIDSIRFIGNPSSGRMGIELALEARARGAEVCLVYGFGVIEPPREGIKIIRVKSNLEMLNAVISELKTGKYNIMIHPAAVSDYGPVKFKQGKMPSGLEEFYIKLRPLPKIIKEARKIDPHVFIVGFKAEYDVPEDELVKRAHKKLLECGADLIVVNDVSKPGAGFGTLTNEVYVVDKEGKAIHIPLTHKREVAFRILKIVSDKLKTKEYQERMNIKEASK